LVAQAVGLESGDARCSRGLDSGADPHKLALEVLRPCHAMSLRFHLERRPAADSVHRRGTTAWSSDPPHDLNICHPARNRLVGGIVALYEWSVLRQW